MRLRERHEHRPGAVDVIGSPAPEPRAVGFLLPAQIRNRTIERRVILRPANACEDGNNPRGHVVGRRIEQRAVIGERNVVEIVFEIVGIERRKAAVAALHPDQPVKRATHALVPRAESRA